MKILAIETSCDDTAIAVVEFSAKGKTKTLANIISSQTEIHKEFGGVYPSLAKREHEKNLPLVIRKISGEAKLLPKFGAIAVTVGPGLDPCLWTGIEFAKKTARENNLPIIPVNHIESHILINFMKKKPALPAIALVVSGGHTQIVLVKEIGRYRVLGETRDDAAGECFDKTARILGLGYPGGPAVAAAAKIYRDPVSVNLPRPMINSKDYDFSFSGLKTAVLYDFKGRTEKERKTEKYKAGMAKEIQQTIIDVLIKKTLAVARDFNAKTVILGGGVSANEELRKQFKKKFKNTVFPEKHFSTDNAVMTAVAGYYHQNKATKRYGSIKALPNLRI